MSDEQEEDCKCPAGLPAWLATFADLMSLLMCFFVLLLAFSEMDVLKFKQIAGSMKMAFGVQNMVNVEHIPKGTSVIAQEFSPGKPIPTPINTVMQQTQEVTKPVLDPTRNESQEEAIQAEVESQAQEIVEQLQASVAKGQIEVEAKNKMVIIRIREKGSFPSGRARLNRKFIPIIAKIRTMLAKTPGKIQVSGHTDTVPIKTARFSSNWELSSARAVAVAHELMYKNQIKPERVSVTGHADTQPIESNKTAKGRAKNRRVEIRITRGNAGTSSQVLTIGEDQNTADKEGSAKETEEKGAAQ